MIRWLSSNLLTSKLESQFLCYFSDGIFSHIFCKVNDANHEVSWSFIRHEMFGRALSHGCFKFWMFPDEFRFLVTELLVNGGSWSWQVITLKHHSHHSMNRKVPSNKVTSVETIFLTLRHYHHLLWNIPKALVLTYRSLLTSCSSVSWCFRVLKSVHCLEGSVLIVTKSIVHVNFLFSTCGLSHDVLLISLSANFLLL